jgi:hypothetical protein
VLSGLRIDFPDRGAALFSLDAVLGDIAVRAYRHKEPLAIAVGQDVFGPVVIDGSCR